MKKNFLKIILFSICFSLINISTAQADWNTWLDHSIIKIKQNGFDSYDNQVNSGNQSVSLKMAKNEFESFQVFIYADGEDLNNVDITVSPLVKGTDSITDIVLYKEWYTNCDVASREEYITGNYPTALLPKVDRYYGETRNTFPFSIEDRNVQGVWVDVGTESTTIPGNYSAIVTVTAEGKTPIELSLNVEVWDFTIPSTATFGSMFAIQDGELSNAHMGSSWINEVNNAMYPLYAKMALYHRISTRPIAGTMGIDYNWDSSSKQLTNMNPDRWTNYYADVLNGTAISSGPYAGAKAISSIVPRWGSVSITDVDGQIANEDKSVAATQYLQAWYDYFGANGWSPESNLYVMVEDEPKTYADVQWRGQTVSEVEKALTQSFEANQINTSIYGDGSSFKHVIMNAHNEDHFDSFVGLFNPWVGHYAPADWEKNNSNSSYIYPKADYPLVDHYWTYLSCMSNDCTNTGNDWYSGQMDLSADAPAFYNRIPSFYLRKQGSTDLWYFQMNLIYDQDPYYDLWPGSGMEGSNGDGQLIYPGVAGEFGGSPVGVHTPNIGGTHDIPIAGIRLKLVRDAMEDMEYFKLAEEQTSATEVDAIVDTMFTNTDVDLSYWNLNNSPAGLFSARDSISSLITGNYIPPACSESDWSHSDENCQPSNVFIRTWILNNQTCVDGIFHPDTEEVSCTYIPPTGIRADVNQDGSINTTDAQLTLRNSLGLDMSATAWQESETTGDVNCDGTTNTTDAQLILRYSLGLNMDGTGWCDGLSTKSSDNFSTDTSDNYTVITGSFAISGGVATGQDWRVSRIMMNSPLGNTDHSVEADIQYSGLSDSSGVLLRTDDNYNGYAVVFEDSRISLYSFNASTNEYTGGTLIAESTTTYTANDYHLKAEVVGNQFKIYVNDILEIDIIDNTYSAGMHVGLCFAKNINNHNVTVDNLTWE